MVLPVVMYGCESWSIKKAESQRIGAFDLWCWRRLLRIPWTAKRSNQSILKEINPEYLLDADAEASIFWPPDVKSWLIRKDPDAGKDWRQEEKGMTEDEMVGWHHRLNGYEFRWTPGVDDGQGGLERCGSWGPRVRNGWATELNWTAARQASLTLTISWSLPKFLCHFLLLLPSVFLSIRVFSKESVLWLRWPKYWNFSFNISPSNEHPGLISFRMDWLDLLAVQGTLKSLLQHHSSKASILLCSV